MSRRGRPRGSRAKQYAVIRELPPQCPRCRSTELEVIKGRKPIVREIAGPDYDRVVWRRKRCKCGQLIEVRTFERINNSVSLSSQTAKDS